VNTRIFVGIVSRVQRQAVSAAAQKQWTIGSINSGLSISPDKEAICECRRLRMSAQVCGDMLGNEVGAYGDITIYENDDISSRAIVNPLFACWPATFPLTGLPHVSCLQSECS